jgi:uracil-DNA glycosylase
MNSMLVPGACRPYLERESALLPATVLVALSAFAWDVVVRLLGFGPSQTRVRLRRYRADRWANRTGAATIPASKYPNRSPYRVDAGRGVPADSQPYRGNLTVEASYS